MIVGTILAILGLLVWLSGPLVGMWIARTRGLNLLLGALLGFFLHVLGWIVLLLLPAPPRYRDDPPYPQW